MTGAIAVITDKSPQGDSCSLLICWQSDLLPQKMLRLKDEWLLTLALSEVRDQLRVG